MPVLLKNHRTPECGTPCAQRGGKATDTVSYFITLKGLA